MRASILLWSTISGAVIGLFIDALLVGVAVILGHAVMNAAGREPQRWLVGIAALVLAAIPVGLAVLGFLEGRLKAI